MAIWNRSTCWAVWAVLCLAPAMAAQQAPSAPIGGTSPAPRPAQALVDEALDTARTQDKLVLVEFGASWCGWCHRFEAFLAEPVVGRLMQNQFVVVHLVALEFDDKKPLENPGAGDLMKSMGGTGGIPFFFFLDGSGKKVADANIMPRGGNVGHPNTPEEIKAFDDLLRRIAPNFTDAERAQIHDYLTKTAIK